MAQALSFDDLVPSSQQQPPASEPSQTATPDVDLIGANGPSQPAAQQTEDPWITGGLGIIDHLERSDAAAAAQSRRTGKSITADQVVSPTGAIGRFQVEPGTAVQYGYDPSKLGDAGYNRQVAGTILSSLRDRYSDDQGNTDWPRVLIGYNAGPGRADKWDGDPTHLPKETQDYLRRGEQFLGLPGAFTGQKPGNAMDFSDLVPGSGKGNALDFADLVPKSNLPKPTQPEDSFLGALAHAATNAWPSFEAAWGSAVQQGAEKAQGGAPSWLQPFMSTATPEEKAKLQKTAQWASGLRATAETEIKANLPNVAPGSAKDMAYQAATGVIQLMPIIAASAATKDPFLAGALIGEQSAAQQYGQSRDQGRNAAQANMDATFSGVTNGALSALPLGIIMKPGQTFLGKMIKGAVSFGAISVIGEGLQIGYDTGIVNEKMTVAQAMDRLKQAGITGALQGAFLAGGHAGLEIAVNHLQAAGTAIHRAANAQGVGEFAGTESSQSQIYLYDKGRAAPAAAGRVEPAALKTPEPAAPGTPGSRQPEAGGAGAVPPATAIHEFVGEPKETAPGRPLTEQTPVAEGGKQIVSQSTKVPEPEAPQTEAAPKPPKETEPQENVRAALSESHVPEERPAGPKWSNAHVIDQEHDDEITRLETEGIVSGSQPKGGKLVDFGDLVPTPRDTTSRPNIDRRDVAPDTAITATGRKVPVQYAVVEADHLVPSQTLEGNPNPLYPQELQPRDRSRITSAAQISDIAQNLNPQLLDKIPMASHGAPIISPDGIVESGNGRTLAVQQAYGNGLDTAEGYRAYLKAQGYPVDGMRKPMLVRVRTGEMTPEDRQAFTREANQSGTMALSATERAMGDAAGLPDSILPLYRGGEVESGENRPFVRAFMNAVVDPADHGAMISPDGTLSQDAIRRVRAALLAKAYGDADLVAKIVESGDEHIRAIGGALTDVAADWAKMRAAARSGEVPPAMDQTTNLINAVRIVRHARANSRNVAEYAGQGDIFSGESITPETEAFLQLMFRNEGDRSKDWTRPVGRDKLAESLRFYLGEAIRAGTGADLLGDEAPTPLRILQLAKARQYPAIETGPGLFTPGATRPGGNAPEGGPAGARPQGAPAAVPPGIPAPNTELRPTGTDATVPLHTNAEIAPASHRLADAIAARLFNIGAELLAAKELYGMAESIYGGSLASGAIPREDLYDALELGVNKYIAGLPRVFDPTTDNVDAAVRTAQLLAQLKDRLPTQSIRAGEKESKQQYSTPPDYSYAATWAANLDPTDRVLEPSAGTGSFVVDAMNAGVDKVWVNELSERRADMLRTLSPDGVFTENAEHIDALLPTVDPTVVLMNPPFSVSPGMEGTRVIEAGSRHVEAALNKLRDGGRLIAIVGKGMAPDAPRFRDWWKKIASQYDIRANIGVDGSIYRKYGTTFDTRLLVIDKTAPSGRAPVVADVKAAAEIVEALKDVRDDRKPISVEPGGKAVVAPGPRPGTAAAPLPRELGPLGTGETSRSASGEGNRPAPSGPRGPSGRPADGEGSGQGVPVAPAEPERPGDVGTDQHAPVGASPMSQSPAGGGGGAGDGIVPDGSGARDDPGITPAPATVRAEQIAASTPTLHDAPITDAIYENYKAVSPIKGTKEHPGALVESAAMGSVDAPQLDYKPKIPDALIKEGALSDAQIEAIARAGASHEQILPASGDDPERRRGFFIGDGTGVGKGREVAGIILDNMMQGRTKHIWVSEKGALINDARRDWEGMRRDPKEIVGLNSFKPADTVKLPHGILFTSYDTLRASETTKGAAVPQYDEAGRRTDNRGKSRVDQLVDWAGKDFGGVIAFDESHNLGNSEDTKGSRGTKEASQKALAGVELQRRLPNARVVYVSATGATEVNNLAYADRLGLWGRGTAFADKKDFVSKIGSGGVAAMELVARDMKAMGQYTARNLSFDGVEYDRLEHRLAAPQREIYDKLADAWQIVLKNFHAAMLASGITKAGPDGTVKNLNAAQKNGILSQFWSTHQRFFNQVITAMQMPTVLKGVERDIAEGRQAVLQLVNTNEAAQSRALNKLEDDADLEDLDMTPRDQLMQMVDKLYPTQRHEEYMDESGNRRSRPVVDGEGNPVHDPRLVAAKERLLTELGSLRVPDGPLEMLLDHFGVDQVAEVTGRKQRVVNKLDDNGQMRKVLEKRPAAANIAETSLFQDGKKPILVFSDAGGTGRSYHADVSSPSANRRRSHYLLQGGWRADKAVQGFGRSHRTNQASAPIFHLVTTDIEGQKRFISSIARRLAQLGALTKGERRTGDQGLFGMRDNLESSEATRALTQFYHDAAGGSIDGIGIHDLEDQMGLKLIDPSTGTLYQKLPPIQQFLNRLLSLNLGMQNKVFNAFSQRMDDIIDRSAAAGTLDTGVETYRADTINKVSDTLVHTDKTTGATTRHAHFEIGRRNRITDFDTLAAGGSYLTRNKAPSGFIRSLRGNKVFATSEATSHTDEAGNVVDQIRLSDPTSYQYLDKSKLSDPRYWQDVKPDEARADWEKQIAATPEFDKSDLHMITGAVLPVWDRLAGSPKVYRLQTDAGERLLGRVVPNDSINDVLAKLGAKGVAVTATPQEIGARVLSGEQAELSNGWKIKRSTVSGEVRLELIGPDMAFLKQLQQDGVFTERIDWKTRFFIPTNQETRDVISRIVADRPVTKLFRPSKAQAAFHGSPYDFDRFENEKIGSGEGAQVYGHGHYFAGKKEVAQYYKDTLGDGKGKLYHVDLAPNDDEWLNLDKPLSEQSPTVQERLNAAGYETSPATMRGSMHAADFYRALADAHSKERMVGSAANQWGPVRYPDKEAASQVLREAGIPGLRYADQMSRLAAAQAEAELPRLRDELDKTIAARDAAKARGDDRIAEHHEALTGDIRKMIAKTEEDVKGATHNYVVFDPEHIKILSKEQRESTFGKRIGAKAVGGVEELAPDTLGYRTAELTPAEKATHDAVMQLARRLVPGAEVRMMRALEAVEPGQEQRGQRILGSNYGPAYRRMIAWSLESPDAVGTMKHEAVHWLRQSGLIRPDEWKVLERAAIDGGWLDKHRIAERYPDLGREDRIEEAVAEEFGVWGRRGRTVPSGIHAIFRRIGEFLAQVGDHMRRVFGADATADNIFSRMNTGEIGQRTQAEVRDQMRSKAQAAKTPEKEPEPEARGIYAAVDRALGAPLRRVGDKLADAIDRMPSSLHDLGEAAQKGMTPMAAGEAKYRAWAKDFANALRASADEHDRVDKYLQKNFTPDEQRQMYDAMDIEGVSKRMDRPIPEGKGLDSLAPRLRATTDELEKRNKDTARWAQKLGMLKRPMENYVPRMGVVWFGDRATRPRGAGGVRSEIGKNLRTTTPQLLRRKYTEIEDTEKAFQARFGEEAEIVHNIRALNLATRNLQQAIAGRELIEKLKADGDALGKATVVEGERADPQHYFTIPGHPAFERWKPEFVNDGAKIVPRLDDQGNVVFKATPLWVAKEAEGPLRAVLSKDQGLWQRALLALKGKTMSLIMYSPAIHNLVIWGRAFPAAPLKLLTPVIYKSEDGWHYGIQLYVDGAAARRDDGLRQRAIKSGMDPIGRRYFNQDITAIAEGADNINPGRSWTAATLAYLPGLYDPAKGDAVRRYVDQAGDFWHNTLLWDRVADLQMGLWKVMTDSFQRHGLPQVGADIAASHFANRYAGVMPMEALGKSARAWANWILFSRSFTLGNLAAFKDAAMGLPRDAQSQIMTKLGPKALDLAQGMARRKAFTLIVGDAIANKINLYLTSMAVAGVVYALTGVWKYIDPSQNEPDYQNKVRIGTAPDGTALYMRLPTGKTTEDQQGWAQEPRNTLLRKLSPMARFFLDILANNKGWNRKLFDENDKTLGGDWDALTSIAGSLADSIMPVGEYDFIRDAMMGQGDLKTNIVGAVTPLVSGITLSKGYPGGPAQGEFARLKEAHDFKVEQAMPDIRRQIRSGDVKGARAAMTALGLPPHEQNFYVRITLNPSVGLSRSERRNLRLYGTPEVRERIQQDLAH